MSVGGSFCGRDKGCARNTLRQWRQLLGTEDLLLWPQPVDPIRFNSIECRWQSLPCTYSRECWFWLPAWLPACLAAAAAYQGPLSPLIIVMVESCVVLRRDATRWSSSYRSLWPLLEHCMQMIRLVPIPSTSPITQGQPASLSQISRQGWEVDGEWCNVWPRVRRRRRRRRSLIAEEQQLNVLCTYTTFVRSPIDRSIAGCCFVPLFWRLWKTSTPQSDAVYSLFNH